MATIPTGTRTSRERPYGELVARQGLPASAQLVLQDVPDGARVLDVGCATGYVGTSLLGRGCTVVGFEGDAASAAQVEGYERVIVGDFESATDRARIDGLFDVVVLGDVLEHLRDPWDALAFSRSLLTDGGVALASIPNVGAWPIRLALLRGSFDYAEHGLMDRTHLRWFTRRSVRDLVHGAGFAIEHERFTQIDAAPGFFRRMLPWVSGAVMKRALHLCPELMAQQFVLRLRPQS